MLSLHLLSLGHLHDTIHHQVKVHPSELLEICLASWMLLLMAHLSLKKMSFPMIVRYSTPLSHHYRALLRTHVKILRLMTLTSLGDLLGFLLEMSRTFGSKKQFTWTFLRHVLSL
jgi:hypothetical protein